MLKVNEALRHPRDAALYLILGKERFRELRGSGGPHTCYKAKESSLPFFLNASAHTDIHEHLATLYMLTVELELRQILELGTRTGESTVALLHGAKALGGHVTSVDIEDCPQAAQLVSKYGLNQYWTFIKSDDLESNWNSPIDHLFIDTSHEFEQTVKELGKFEPMVKEGGIITMHDSVSCPDLRRAVLTFLQGRKDLHLYEYLNNNGLLVIFKRH